MLAQVNELLLKKYFGIRPVTPLHNLYLSKPIFTRPKDGWTGGWLSAWTRSFSVFGPKTWNGLPVDLRHLPNGACSQFHHLLKTVLFRLAWVGRRISRPYSAEGHRLYLDQSN